MIKAVPTMLLAFRKNKRTDIELMIASMRNAYGFPQGLLEAMIEVESKGVIDAVGKTGDYGLMQVTLPALTDYNYYNKTKHVMADLLNPLLNIRIGAWYLNRMYRFFKTWPLAIRGYNGGFAVDKNNTISLDYFNRVQEALQNYV